MIKGVIVVNNYGKPRLVKFYEDVDFSVQKQTIREIFTQVSKRKATVCNFLSTGSVKAWPDTLLVYRHYATLYFVFAVDHSESQLGMLDLIQVFVEALDNCFKNVCELDLIFKSETVHHVLDEIIMGGMVLETNTQSIIAAIKDMQKLEEFSDKKVAADKASRQADSGRKF
eukprot:INCI4400.1.p2 GENE.INCI4400.1~~INCI4400.1.p2  ORF type:complete len:171 (-),score=31.43 INCI4400.1:1035-1547(-)